MSNQLTQQEINNLVINVSATAQLLHELLDDLSETTYFRQSLKHAGKRFQMELAKTCDSQTNDLWNAHEESMVAVQDGIAGTIREMVKADPLTIAAIGNLLKHDAKAIDKLELV